LKKVDVHTGFPLHKPVKLAGILDKKTEAYPDKLMTEVTIHLKDGKKFSINKEDYHGFFTNPLSWNDVIEKFKKLTGNKLNEPDKNAIINIIQNLENYSINDLLQKIILQ
jgi:2-methylcitrate dehydratase